MTGLLRRSSDLLLGVAAILVVLVMALALSPIVTDQGDGSSTYSARPKPHLP